MQHKPEVFCVGEATFTFRVDEALKADFARAAKDADRTAAQLLRDFMRDYIRNREDDAAYDAWFIAEVDKGIAEADAGKLIPHEQVLAESAAWRAELRPKVGDSKA
jgi:predicted transcriptional regulator